MLKRLLIPVTLLLTLVACHDIEEFDNDPQGNFRALWSILDEHYCFFADKEVDWDAVYAGYAPRISDRMTNAELWETLSAMAGELRDGHTNLSSAYGTSYYRAWWSDYPQDYSERLVEQYYFNFNYRQAGGLTYGILQPNVGYLRVASFSSGFSDSNLDVALDYLATTDALIIDIRDNGGGMLTYAERLVRRFINKKTLVGYITHKDGPGHGDFAKPYPIEYEPAPAGRILWGKPVAVLTNRSTFSAANHFATVMRHLPNTVIAGATTGGGSGMPFTSELPNGWHIRFSASPTYDAQMVCTEHGVTPTPGWECHLDPLQALDGHDTMIDHTVNLLLQ